MTETPVTGTGAGESGTPRRHRPRLLIITCLIFISLLLIGSAAFWIGLPAEIRGRFNRPQIATLIVFVGFIAVLFTALAASSVRVGADDVMITNGFRRHRVPWSELRKIVLRDGDPFAYALLRTTNAEGQPGRRAMYGLQSVDGERTAAAVRQLNSEIERRRLGT